MPACVAADVAAAANAGGKEPDLSAISSVHEIAVNVIDAML